MTSSPELEQKETISILVINFYAFWTLCPLHDQMDEKEKKFFFNLQKKLWDKERKTCLGSVSTTLAT